MNDEISLLAQQLETLLDVLKRYNINNTAKLFRILNEVDILVHSESTGDLIENATSLLLVWNKE